MVSDNKLGSNIYIDHDFLFCRHINSDDSEGYSKPTPGVKVRISLNDISSYVQFQKEVVEIYLVSKDDPIPIFGFVEDIDEAMRKYRTRIKLMPKSKN